MDKYNSIYDYINELSGLEKDKRIMELAILFDKRFGTAQVKLVRGSFSKLEKEAIIKMLKDKGCKIGNEENFFVKELNEKEVS